MSTSILSDELEASALTEFVTHLLPFVMQTTVFVIAFWALWVGARAVMTFFRHTVDAAPAPAVRKVIEKPAHRPAFEPIMSSNAHAMILDEFTGKGARARAIAAYAGPLFDETENMVLVHTPQKSIYVVKFPDTEHHNRAMIMQMNGQTPKELGRLEEFHK